MVTTGFKQISYQNADFSLSVNERLSSNHLIVCLPALGCTKESFDALFSSSALEPYSIWAVDLLGHGESDKPEDFVYSMDEHAKIVSLLIDQFAPTQVSVVAHSMGGAVGLLLADHGVDIDRFVSVEGNMVSEDCGYASRLIAGQSFRHFADTGFAEFLDSLRNRTPGAWRIWWHYGPEADQISVIQLGPHPD